MNNNLAVVISNDNICSPLETIDTVKKVGFNNVFIQWYDKEYKEFDISQEEQLKYIKDNNLNVIFAHLGYKNINNIWLDNEIGEELLNKYLRNLEECKNNNISMVIMHLCSKDVAPEPNELGLKRLRIICNKAKELNIKVAFENTKIKGYLEYVLSNIKEDNVGICYDAGHAHAHFNDEFNFEFFKNKIFAVHLHDNFGSTDEHLIPFDGTINWEYVMKKLKENNYNGPITLELCYRNKYSNMTTEEFYTKGLEAGKKLYELFNK